MSDKKNAPRLGKGLSMLMGSALKAVPVSPPPQVAAPAPAPAVAKPEPTPAKAAPAPVPAAVKIAPGAAPKAPAPVVARGTSSANVQVPVADVARGTETIQYLAVSSLRPNPHQPRQRFAEEPLKQLAESIKRDGIMQPILARPGPVAGQFELVAGERRWRAAQLAGLAEVPVIVRTLSEEQSAEWALVENLQREDLGPMEKAESLDRLAKKFNLTHQMLAEKLGLDRSSITNLLRLLTLHPECRKWVEDGLLSMSHAKALAGIGDPTLQLATARRALQEGWSVRRTESEVQRLAAPTLPAPVAAGAPAKVSGSHLGHLEKQIGSQLGLRVSIRPGKKKGTGQIVVAYANLDQFDTLLERMRVRLEE